MKSYYMIDGYNDRYNTLYDVRLHVSISNASDQASYDGTMVVRIIGDECANWGRIIRIKRGKVVLEKV